MRKVARHLEPKFRTDEMLAVAQEPAPKGELLAQLYLERCYKLASEDYAAVADLERRITAARAGR
jgi:hypothetical protein